MRNMRLPRRNIGLDSGQLGAVSLLGEVQQLRSKGQQATLFRLVRGALGRGDQILAEGGGGGRRGERDGSGNRDRIRRRRGERSEGAAGWSGVGFCEEAAEEGLGFCCCAAGNAGGGGGG